MKPFFRYMMFITALMLCSCAFTQAKNARICEEFDRNAKTFNKMLRWREVENAGMMYMVPELRDTFIKNAGDFKKLGVTITDYRILTTKCTPEKMSADVITEFDYFTLPSNRVKTLTYHQKWSYLDSDDKKGWQLKSALPLFD